MPLALNVLLLTPQFREPLMPLYVIDSVFECLGTQLDHLIDSVTELLLMRVVSIKKSVSVHSNNKFFLRHKQNMIDRFGADVNLTGNKSIEFAGIHKKPQ